jgi:hypothetical protein
MIVPSGAPETYRNNIVQRAMLLCLDREWDFQDGEWGSFMSVLRRIRRDQTYQSNGSFNRFNIVKYIRDVDPELHIDMKPWIGPKDVN